jgi:CHAT domain-containing protein
LQYLPFAVLPTVQSNSLNVYLIETNEIISLPSASTIPLLRQLKTKRKTPQNQLAILADPVFSKDDLRLNLISKQKVGQQTTENTSSVMRNAQTIQPILRSDFSRLRFSRIEAEGISELAGQNQRLLGLDFAANLKTVKGENLQKSRIIHLATHGIVNSQFPELSSIVLSLVDEKGDPQEGFLRLQDVYNLRLEADLVVLSACETGLGKEIKGEGIVGLTRGFMYAGAPSVVASLWQVEDRATADLMKRFYQRMLIEKLPVSTAFRQAQISMLKEKTSAHPFYWAGFTLQGDWK